MKKYLVFALALFSLFLTNTKATTSSVGRGNIIFNDSTWFSQYGYWGVNVGTSGTNVNVSSGCDLDNFSCVNFSALVLDVCSEDSILVSRTSDYAASCTGSCFSQNFILKDMYSSCKTNSGNDGFQFRLYLPVSKWNVGSGNTRLWSVDDTIKIRSKNYNALVTIFGAYYTDENITSDGYDFSIIDGQIKNTNSKLDDVKGKQDQTNSKLDDVKGKQDEAEKTRKGILGKIGEILTSIVNLPKKIVDLVVDGLKSLFIPDDTEFITNFVDSIENKLGFIAEVPISVINFGLGLVNASWTEVTSISFPSINIFGYYFWDSQDVDITTGINIFKPYKYITDVLCVVLCVATLNKWREKFTGGGS